MQFIKHSSTTIKVIAVVLFFGLALSGCGQKGDLFIPADVLAASAAKRAAELRVEQAEERAERKAELLKMAGNATPEELEAINSELEQIEILDQRELKRIATESRAERKALLQEKIEDGEMTAEELEAVNSELAAIEQLETERLEQLELERIAARKEFLNRKLESGELTPEELEAVNAELKELEGS